MVMDDLWSRTYNGVDIDGRLQSSVEKEGSLIDFV